MEEEKHMENRTLYFGDNLEILRKKIPDESFDLIYLDPPFNSNRSYNVIFQEGLKDSPAQTKAFEDSWHWTAESKHTFDYLVTKTNENISNLMLALEKTIGHNDMLAYLIMMAVRLIELHRVLKDTGSLYLHCDPTASHYLKIVLDVIFGKNNFQNEIVWTYRRWPSKSKSFQRMHDIIFFYTKNTKSNYIFNTIYQPLSEITVKIHKGRKQKATFINGKRLSRDQEEDSIGTPIADYWYIPAIAGNANERLGYPTQKPEALLDQILKASSKEGDWILDPFCGCGTAVAVAERLNRRWVGIDITALAINLVKHRIRKQFVDKNVKIFIDGLPKDLSGAKELAKKDPFEFEYWVCDLVNAMPAQSKTEENMRGADKGIDGIITFSKGTDEKNNYTYGKVIVQVKSGKVQRSDIATLKGDIEREKADMGLFVTLEEPTQPMKNEAVSTGTFSLNFSKKDFPRIQIITIEELLNGKQPNVPLLYSMPYYKEAKQDDIDEIEWKKNQFNLGL